MKIDRSLFSSGKRHTYAHTCIIYNKRSLSPPQGYKKRGIIMKATTYRINLYTSIGKCSFDISDKKVEGVHYCAKLGSIILILNFKREIYNIYVQFNNIIKLSI